MVCDNVEMIHLAHDNVQWGNSVNIVMNYFQGVSYHNELSCSVIIWENFGAAERLLTSKE
jgi:hypothetical protein